MNTGYRIGAVAKLTGISTDTIRAWERRYGVVEPNRGENNNRYYTDNHVQKLLNVKRLVDAGQAIGTICSLSDQELQERSNGLLGIDKRIACRNWLVVSRQRPGWLTTCVSARSDNKVTYCSDFDELSPLMNRVNFEFIVVDMPSLSEANEQKIKQHVLSRYASRCLVVYRYASRPQLRNLSSAGFKLLKGPLEPYALVNLLGGDGQDVMPRKFTDGQIQKALNLNCEYTRRISETISALNRFEDFCTDDRTEDDEVLERIRSYTGSARSAMEQALGDFMEKRGFSLPDPLD